MHASEPNDTDARPRRRCAVVFNPQKVSSAFRSNLEAALGNEVEALWLETTADDPGQGMTARAVEEDVGLVIGAGGDGTIRVVAAGLANTGIPFGLIPAGTGNLLARNLAIPLQESKAIEVALADHTRTIDLLKVTADGEEPEHSAVMAGIGLDAAIMDDTDTALKARVGSAAYFMAATKQLDRRPLRATVRVDDQKTIKRRASVCLIGNVGGLQANITLIPGAEPDDGRLDVLVASPRRVKHWLHLMARIVSRREQPDDRVTHLTGRSVTVELAHPERFQIDGDAGGTCTRLTAEIVPGALIIKVPAT